MKRIGQSIDSASRSERQPYLPFRQENTTRAVAGIDAGLINGHPVSRPWIRSVSRWPASMPA